MREHIIFYQQCTAPDGSVGSFLLDANRQKLISPVFADTVDAFFWMAKEGWKLQEGSICRKVAY